MNLLRINRSKATVVVGDDFGTTFSGFAFALTSKPDDVHKFYEWPDLGAAGGGNYCKTITSLLYEDGQSSGSYVLQDWGHSALLKHMRGIGSRKPEQITHGDNALGNMNQLPPVPGRGPARRTPSHYLTLFKLHLVAGASGRTSAAELPEGLNVRRVISDYLRKLSEIIMTTIQKRMGSHMTMEDCQWCLTVPAIWDDRSKQAMKICAAMAGMIQGPECPLDLADTASPHPMIIVLEPEAASFYCQKTVPVPLTSGDKFLIVDVGGGTVDLVLHEKIGAGAGLQVREVSPSAGGLFGGSYVDKAFFEFLSRKIGCFNEFARTNTESVLKLKGWWETAKCGFDGSMDFSYDLELPARLARAWELHDSSNKVSNLADCYDTIELTLADMHSLFDPLIDEIIKLIESKMIEELKAMMLVGGFTGSPYLVKRIRQEFTDRVENIVIPNEPGAAICCGAVLYGIYGADLVCSRKSKKTYGINIARRFFSTDPPHLMFQDDNGESFCSDVYCAYTKINDEVPLDHSVIHKFYPLCQRQTEMSVSLFSTTDPNPKYVCDPGVTKEGTFHITFPSSISLGETPEVSVSMFFGRTLIEVQAEGLNFGSGEKFTMPTVSFERAFE